MAFSCVFKFDNIHIIKTGKKDKGQTDRGKWRNECYANACTLLKLLFKLKSQELVLLHAVKERVYTAVHLHDTGGFYPHSCQKLS